MSKLKLIGLSCMLALAVMPRPATAQYMYLDASGDGLSSLADSVRVPGTTVLDVWLRTDQNRDGSPATCAAGGTPPLAFSYEFNLLATGGMVSWGTYTNNITAFTPLTGVVSDSTHFYAGYAGSAQFSPGLYKLGTVVVFVTSGRPRIDIVAEDLSGPYWTMFGSTCGAGQSADQFQLGNEWFDADGLSASSNFVAFTELFDYPNGTANPPWADTGNPWQSTGFPSWGFTSSNSSCDFWLGTHSATAAGPSYCGTYPASSNNALSFEKGINVSRLVSYRMYFVERHKLMPDPAFFTDDYLYYLIQAGQSEDPFTMTARPGGGSLTGSTTGWSRQYTLDVDNSGSNPLYTYARPVFGLVGNQIPGSGIYGAWIDSVQIIGTQRPDLAVNGSVTASGSSTTTAPLVAGQTWYLKFRVQNFGETASGGFRIKVYLDNSATELTYREESGLGVGAFRDITWQLSGSTLTGGSPHSVKIKLDSENAVYESDATQNPENNNTFPFTGSPPLQFTWNAPDLRVQSPLLSPSNPEVGQVLQLTVTVRNAGSQAITTPFSVAWYRNRSSAPNKTQPYDSLLTVSSLGANASVNLVFRYTSTQARTDSMYVFADRDSVIAYEISESNNILGPVLVTWVPKTIVVVGRFQFADSLHGLKTIPCNTVVLCDSDAVGVCDTVFVGSLDATGAFVLGPVENRDNDQGLLDLYVQFYLQSNENCWDATYPGNWFISVKDSLGKPWHIDTGRTDNVQGDSLKLGVITPTGYGQLGALHIYQTLVDRGWAYVRNNLIPPPRRVPGVQVWWSPGFSHATAYRGADSTLWINGTKDTLNYFPDEWDDAVILHEYGHHLSQQLGFAGNLAGTNAHAYNAACSSTGWAWYEGFSDMFGAFTVNDPGIWSHGLILDYGMSASGVRKRLAVDVESDSLTVYAGNSDIKIQGSRHTTGGSFWELSVAGALWDILDTNVDQGPGPQSYLDSLATPLFVPWGVLEASAPTGHYIWDVCSFDSLYRSTLDPYPYNVSTNSYADWNHYRWIFWQHGMNCGADQPTAVELQAGNLPRMRLLGTSPNPFNPATQISFFIPQGASAATRLRIFDVTGRSVCTLLDGVVKPGFHRVVWDGRVRGGGDAGSGIYFCRLEWNSQASTRKMALLK